MKKLIIVTTTLLLVLVVYKVAFTAYMIHRLELDYGDIGQDYIPLPLDRSLSPPGPGPSSISTDEFSVRITAAVTEKRALAGNQMCKLGDFKLRFMTLVTRSQLLDIFPWAENLKTDQILEKVYSTTTKDILLALLPSQIIRAVALYKLKTVITTTLCEKQWHTVTYGGKKCFVAVGPKALSIDIPTTDGQLYVSLAIQKHEASIEDIALLESIRVSSAQLEK